MDVLWMGVIVAVGVFALLVGVLLVAAWRRRAGMTPFSSSARVTRTGFLVYGVLVASLVMGLVAVVMFPGSAMGHWLRTSEGLFTYLVVLVAVVGVVRSWLHGRGISLLVDKPE